MTSTNKLEIGKVFFEEGIPGFAHLQFFTLVQEEAGSSFYLLQSLEDEQVAFWVVEPFAFFKDYEFELHAQAKTALHITDEVSVTVLNIVTVRSEGQVTVNMKAPIVINQDNRMAKQIILNEERYQVRQPLFPVKQAANE